MTDFRVDLNVRNGRILRRMNAAGIWTVAELSRRCGCQQTEVGAVINLRKRPFTAKGEWRTVVHRLAETLNCMPDDLFSPAQREMRLASNKAYIEVSDAEIDMLVDARRQDALPADRKIARQELEDRMNAAIDTLIPRQARALRLRYGLEDGSPHTLEETGAALGVTRERVRQIVLRAERHLRSKMEKWQDLRNETLAP